MDLLIKAIYVIMLDKPVVHSSGYINKNMTIGKDGFARLQKFMTDYHYPKIM
jgi:hypothetical protein